jgi:hypothetical protein
MEFVEPWYSIEAPGGTIADSLVNELKRELSEKHLLYNQLVTVIARRTDCDDVLLKFGTPNEKFAVVHLTFSGKCETNPNFPRTEIFASFGDFVNNRMQQDALQFSN